MQLSDVFEETDAIEDATEELRFQKYLKWLSELPTWKRKEMWERIKKAEGRE